MGNRVQVGGDSGSQGSRPGSTFQEMRQKARSGSLHGKQYPQDSFQAGQRGGGQITQAGQGTNVVTKTALSPGAASRTGNDPYKRPSIAKPGAEPAV